MNLNKALVIVASPGIGKTYCGKKYKNVLDLESVFYQCIFDKNVDVSNKEKLKAVKNKKLNPNFPQNYVNDLILNLDKYNVIFVALKEPIIKELIKNKIDFVILVPNKADKLEYIKRFKNRGNSSEFIQRAINSFENFDLYKKYGRLEELLQNEYMEDYLKRKQIKLIEK